MQVALLLPNALPLRGIQEILVFMKVSQHEVADDQQRPAVAVDIERVGLP
jgi:hypothetical protein